MRILLFGVSMLTSFYLFAQQSIDSAAIIAQTISAEELKAHLTIIASDEYEGRETGTAGQEKAAAYIKTEFAKNKLEKVGDNGTYGQRVYFGKSQWEEVDLNSNGESFRHLWDYYAFPSFNPGDASITGEEILFIGYGIEEGSYSDYNNIDVVDKILLINPGEPRDAEGLSYLTGKADTSDWSKNVFKKIQLAKTKGAKAVLYVDEDYKKNIGEIRKYLISPRLSLGDNSEFASTLCNHMFISSTVAKAIIGKRSKKVRKALKRIRKKGQSRSVKIPCALSMTFTIKEEKLISENVVGLVSGIDPEKKDEVVIVSAHYDHLGKRGNSIYNGADDNGTGTSTVLELAEAFAQAKADGLGPKRSVLFILATGEEKGLLGSQYYVEYPIFPIEQSVANVNIDMIGRRDDKHADNPDYIYVIGADRLSTELHNINEAANKKYSQLELDYTYNEKNDPNRYYYRSDHYNFAKKGIPAIFYFSGVHEDYHMTSDTVEKIEFEKMEKIGKLIFHTIWELANRDKRILVDKG